MKKSIILVTILVIGIGIGVFVNDRMKYTTYEEVITDMISEENTVREITVRNSIPNNLEISIEDEEIIERLLEEPSRMELKEYDGPSSIDYLVTIHTDTDRYQIIFGENDAQVGDVFYKVVNDNILEQVVENENFEWKKRS